MSSDGAEKKLTWFQGRILWTTCRILWILPVGSRRIHKYPITDCYFHFRNHYIEYLGQLIMKHNIDPIEILEEHELEMVMKRNNFPLPEKVDYDYSQSLVEVSPLNRLIAINNSNS